MSNTKLFCLPYAGGSSSIYSRWNKQIGDSIEVIPIEPSGRGKRYNQPLYDSVEEAVCDIYEIIRKETDGSPDYAIFGHSLGGIIAYELAYKIKAEGRPYPIHIFFSGVKAPNLKTEGNRLHDLPDDEFKQKVFELGGTPAEILENEELLELFLPILRADFRINENYRYTERKEKIDCGITVIYGKKEDMKLHEIVEWRNHTEGQCSIYMLDGDHFFINTHTEDVLKIIKGTLNK